MKKTVILIILAFVGLISVFCQDNVKIKRGGTVRTVMPSGPIPDNINPFLEKKKRSGVVDLIYECLLYTSLNGKEYPLLAASNRWESDRILIYDLRKNIYWSDKTSFTSKDVVFTFEYMKKHRELDVLNIWGPANGLNKVSAKGDYQVVFEFDFDYVLRTENINSVLIVPEHIWKDIEDPVHYKNDSPIGTGPFLIKEIMKEDKVIYAKRNPGYWNNGKPYIDLVEMNFVKDQKEVMNFLMDNKADWNFTYFSYSDQKVIEKLRHANFRFFRPPVNSVIWYLNTKKPPLDDPNFRKALAYTVDRDTMSKQVYFDIGASHPSGIQKVQLNEWFPKELNDKLYDFNNEKAKIILMNAGYKIDNGALFDPKGNKVRTFKILIGAGWTDYIDLSKIIIDNLKELGISAVIDEQQWDDYYPNLQKGNYDTGISWGQGIGANPFNMYYRNLGHIQNKNNTNLSFFENKTIFDSLDAFQRSVDPSVQKKAINDILTVFLDNVPYIPLTNSSSCDFFNVKDFAGWPSDDNLYADGPPDSQAGAIILTNVHLK